MADSHTGEQGKVFVSYSRKDKEFVRKLHDGLVSSEIDPWVDWEGIPFSADWMAEITAAIEAADAFIFVISPDSLNSRVCLAELEQGLIYSKKLLPVLYREPSSSDVLPERLAATNWVYLREQDDFAATLPGLIEAIYTDLDWVRMHTRLLGRAAEWDRKKRNASFLLHGTDLEEAESWQTQAGGKMERQVTSLHAEYILTSRQEALRRQRSLLAGVSVALIVTLFLAVFALFQRSLAVRNEERAKVNELRAINSEKTAIYNADLAEANARLAATNEADALSNALLAANNEATAIANQQLAQDNEKKALSNEAEARRQEKIVRAQRIAAEAQSIQEKRPNELHLSMLLAVESYQRDASNEAEQVLRENLTLMPRQVFAQREGWAVNDVTYSQDGARLLVASDDGTAQLWDTSTGKQLLELAHEGAVYAANFGNHEQYILTASADGTARVWDAQDGDELYRFQHPNEVNDVDMGPDVRWLATACDDGRVRVWMLPENRMLVQMVHNAEVYDVEYRPDGKRIASAGADGLAIIWSNLSGGNYAIVKHNSGVVSAHYSPDGRFLLTASQDGSAKVVNADTGAAVFTVYHDDRVEDAVFSPNGQLVATASDDYSVRIWSLATLKEVTRMRHDDFVKFVAFSPDNNWLATASQDGTVRLWSTTTGLLAAVMPLEDAASRMAFSPDGRYLSTSTYGGAFMIWDLAFIVNHLYAGVQSEVIRMAVYSPDGSQVAVASDGRVVNLFRTSWMREGRRNIFTGQYLSLKEFPVGLAYHPNGSKLAVAAGGDGVYIWDLASDQSIRLPAAASVRAVAFSPDGSFVASGEADGTVTLWDVSGAISRTIGVANSSVSTVAFSPDGQLLASGGEDGLVQIWRANASVSGTSEAAAELRHDTAVLGLAFSSDGLTLASGSFGLGAYLWDVTQALVDDTALEPKFTLPHGGSVNHLVFSPDGAQLFTVSSDRYLRVWDTASGDELARLAHNQQVLSVALAPDGQGVLTTSGKLLLEWNWADFRLVRASDLIAEACSRLARNFTNEEWQRLVGDTEYHLTCENLP